MLVDPLTGSAARLPFFPDNDDMKPVLENSRGVIYDDGTSFLYNISIQFDLAYFYGDGDEDSDSDNDIAGRSWVFRVAIRYPGDGTVWKFVDRTIDVRTPIGQYSAAYHDGTIIISIESNFHGLALFDADTGDTIVAQRMDEHELWSMPDGEVVTYWRESTHFLESGGELLRVCVLTRRDGNLKGQGAAGHARALAVTVDALEGVVEDADAAGGRVMKWARRDGGSLADRVLFLGFPTSFSVDGAEDDVIGGCTYFCHSWFSVEWSGLKQRCVWLVEGMTCGRRSASPAAARDRYT
jgi:hypothetical protein